MRLQEFIVLLLLELLYLLLQLSLVAFELVLLLVLFILNLLQLFIQVVVPRLDYLIPFRLVDNLRPELACIVVALVLPELSAHQLRVAVVALDHHVVAFSLQVLE